MVPTVNTTTDDVQLFDTEALPPAHFAGLDRLRGWLADLVEMSYQAIGYRRVKNPRIWSMHDIAELTRGARR